MTSVTVLLQLLVPLPWLLQAKVTALAAPPAQLAMELVEELQPVLRATTLPAVALVTHVQQE